MLNFSLLFPRSQTPFRDTSCTSFQVSSYLYASQANVLYVVDKKTSVILYKIFPPNSYHIVSYVVNPLRLANQLQFSNKILILYQKQSQTHFQTTTNIIQQYELTIFSQDTATLLSSKSLHQTSFLKLISCQKASKYILLLTPSHILIFDVLLQAVIAKCPPPFQMHGQLTQSLIDNEMQLFIKQNHGRVTKISVPFLFLQTYLVKLLLNLQQLHIQNRQIPLLFRSAYHQTVSMKSLLAKSTLTRIIHPTRLLKQRVSSIKAYSTTLGHEKMTESKLHFSMGYGLWLFYGTETGLIIGVPLTTGGHLCVVTDQCGKCSVNFIHFGSRLLIVSLVNGTLIAYRIQGLPSLLEKKTLNTSIDFGILREFSLALSAPIVKCIQFYQKMPVQSNANVSFYLLRNQQVVSLDYEKCIRARSNNTYGECLSFFRGVKEETIKIIVMYDYVALLCKRGMHLFSQNGYQRFVPLQSSNNQQNSSQYGYQQINSYNNLRYKLNQLNFGNENKLQINALDLIQKVSKNLLHHQEEMIKKPINQYEGQLLDNFTALLKQSNTRAVQSADEDFIQIYSSSEGNFVIFQLYDILQSFAFSSLPLSQIIKKNSLFFTFLRKQFHLNDLINESNYNLNLHISLRSSMVFLNQMHQKSIAVCVEDRSFFQVYTYLIGLSIMNALLQKHPSVIKCKQNLLSKIIKSKLILPQNTIFKTALMACHPHPIISQSIYEIQKLLYKRHVPSIHSIFLTNIVSSTQTKALRACEMAWMVYFSASEEENTQESSHSQNISMYSGNIIGRIIEIMKNNYLNSNFGTLVLRLLNDLMLFWDNHFNLEITAICLRAMLRLHFTFNTVQFVDLSKIFFVDALLKCLCVFLKKYPAVTIKVLRQQSMQVTFAINYPSSIVYVIKQLIVSHNSQYFNQTFVKLIYIIIECASTANLQVRKNNQKQIHKCLSEMSKSLRSVCLQRDLFAIVFQNILFVYCLKSGKSILQANFEKFGEVNGKPIIQISPKGNLVAALIGKHLHILKIEKIGCGRCLSFPCQATDCTLQWQTTEESISVIKNNSANHLLFKW